MCAFLTGGCEFVNQARNLGAETSWEQTCESYAGGWEEAGGSPWGRGQLERILLLCTF